MTYKLLKDGKVINTIVGTETFVSAYCKEMGYTYEEVPGELKHETEIEIKSEPTEEDDIAAILVDHEYRLILLELGLME